MKQHESLAKQFEENRGHLRAVAYRMLGSQHEADDALQECWLRLSRSCDSGRIENLGGWLTTVVARICLDMLRSRTSRREQSLDIAEAAEPIESEEATSPEYETLMADSVGLALMVVLGTLTPPERVAFVLHDMFDLPFEEIAPIVGRSATSTRQLASRARRRVQSAAMIPDSQISRRRKVVDAFFAASRNGDFDALLAVLDPDVVLHADRVAVDLSAAREVHGAPKLAPEIRGAAAVAQTFKGRAGAAQPALINGTVGLVWAPGKQARAVFAFAITGEKIVGIDLIADPERIRQLDISM